MSGNAGRGAETRNAPHPRTWLWLLVAGAVLSHGSHSLIRPTSTYKLIAFDAGTLTVGLVSALYALFPLILALRLGARAQRYLSLRPLLSSGALISAAGAALVAWGDSVLLVASGSAVMGLGQLMYIIAGQAAVARFAENSQLDAAFGWLTAGVSAGQVIGPLIGGSMLNTSLNGVAGRESAAVIDQALWVGVVIAGLLVVLMQFSGTAYRSRSVAPGESEDAVLAQKGSVYQGKGPRVLEIVRIPRVPSHVFASLVSISMMDILQVFLPLIGEEAGISAFWVGVLLAVRAASSFISRLLLPLLRRRFTRYALVVTGLLVSGTTLTAVPLLASQLWLSGALMAVSGFFLGLAQPLTMTMVAQAVPDDWCSSALALRLVGNRLGQVVVPVAAGVVAGPLGPAGAVWLASLCLLASGTEKLRYGRDDG